MCDAFIYSFQTKACLQKSEWKLKPANACILYTGLYAIMKSEIEQDADGGVGIHPR